MYWLMQDNSPITSGAHLWPPWTHYIVVTAAQGPHCLIAPPVSVGRSHAATVQQCSQ